MTSLFYPFFCLLNQVKERDDFVFGRGKDGVDFFNGILLLDKFFYGEPFKPAVQYFSAGEAVIDLSAVVKINMVAQHSAVYFFAVVSVHGILL